MVTPIAIPAELSIARKSVETDIITTINKKERRISQIRAFRNKSL